MKPVIVITPAEDFYAGKSRLDFRYRTNSIFVKAVADAGGLPIQAFEENCEELMRAAGGVLFTGGPDLDPALYGASREGAEFSPERDGLELAILRAARARGIPMLGICRGIQTINVGFGGSLWQDVPTQIPDPVNHAGTWHEVRTEPDTLLRELYGARMTVNSFHHQAVRELGEGLRVSARTEDGVIEALEHETLPVWGFQWHAEYMTGCARAHMRWPGWSGVTPKAEWVSDEGMKILADMDPVFSRFIEAAREKTNGGV